MVYIDQNGDRLERVDLTLGYLEDAEWIDHGEVAGKHHYAYEALPGGGKLQKIVVDVPRQAAWREVTVQRYIPYTADELAAIARGEYGARLDKLEAHQAEYEAAYERGVQSA